LLKAAHFLVSRGIAAGQPNFCKFLLISASLTIHCGVAFAQSSLLARKASDASQFKIEKLNVRSTAPLYDPFHITVSNSTAYLTDYANSVIKQIPLVDGSTAVLAGQTGEFGSADGTVVAARFGQPAGIWSDGANVYVTDAYFDTIRKISLSTEQVTTLAGSATAPSGSTDGIGSAARFRSPLGIWGDGTYLYVCDSLNFTIRRLHIGLNQVTTLAGKAGNRGTADGNKSRGRFYAPTSAWGNGGYLYVGDGSAVRKVTIATGDVETVSGDPGVSAYVDGTASEARFGFITGIWGDGSSLFVADSGNDAIRKVSLQTGSVTTVSSFVDGNGKQAVFDSPAGLTGSGGLMYIADRNNRIIWKALPVPVVTTGVSPASATPATRAANSGVTTTASTPKTPPSNSVNTTSRAVRTSSPPPASQFNFQLQGGGVSRTTPGVNETVTTGYAPLTVGCCATPAGFALMSYRKGGILLSEATLPLSQVLRSGRIAVQMNDAVGTGLIASNPGTDAVTLTFHVTDENGENLYSGTMSIPARVQMSAMLNQSPFAPAGQAKIDLTRARTFTFSSSGPIGMAAIRAFTNEHWDLLFTSVPVVPLGTTDSFPNVFAHFVTGGGWNAQLELVNPTDNLLSGVATFFNGNVPGVQNGTPREQVAYSIPPRSAVTIQPSGASSTVQPGWIRVTPSSGMPSPSGFVTLSFQTGGITTSRTAIPATTVGSSFRLFVEASGDPGRPGSSQSAFGISNPADDSATVGFQLFGLDGTPAGPQASLIVPAHNHTTMFLNQLPGFENLQSSFQGFLQITGQSIAVVGLKVRYNERGDLVVVTTPPAGSESLAPYAKSLFPYFADGGGFTTQFLLFSPTPGQDITGSLSFIDSAGNPLPVPTR
jgi:hypothetical protein